MCVHKSTCAYTFPRVLQQKRRFLSDGKTLIPAHCFLGKQKRKHGQVSRQQQPSFSEGYHGPSFLHSISKQQKRETNITTPHPGGHQDSLFTPSFTTYFQNASLVKSPLACSFLHNNQSRHNQIITLTLGCANWAPGILGRSCPPYQQCSFHPVPLQRLGSKTDNSPRDTNILPLLLLERHSIPASY